MEHRHLNHQQLTLAAIDDIIARGTMQDWQELRLALKRDPALKKKIQRVCQPYLADPYNQRHHFWNNYVKNDTPRLGRPHLGGRSPSARPT